MACVYVYVCNSAIRSEWPRGLTRGCAAARWLGLWVRIPLRAWSLALVSVVCCQVEVSASGLSLVQRSPADYVVSEYNRGASTMRRLWPKGAVGLWGNITEMSVA